MTQLEYWKKRCEAAEKLDKCHFYDTYLILREEWQSLVSQENQHETKNIEK